MKIRIKLLVTAALILEVAIPKLVWADSLNLIQNPNLETSTNSTMPDHWSIGGYGSSTKVFNYPVEGRGGVGDKAANITVTNYVDGDSKWVFENVPVTPGTRYGFSDSYKSDVNTQIAAIFCTDLNCTTQDFTHGQWANFAPTEMNTWATATAEFIAPGGANFMTVSHLLYSNGSLSLDNFSLTELPPITPLSKGFVTLTFDDGWESQYLNALPVLKAAGYKGSFYIISNAIASSSVSNQNILCNDSANPVCDGAVISTTTSSWKASNQYPDPALRNYTFSENYTSNASSILTIAYFNSQNQAIKGIQNILLPNIQPGSNQFATVSFTIPTSTSYLTLSQTVASGKSLVVTNPTLIPSPGSEDSYMTAAQILEMQANGQEIGAHTEDHCDLAKIFTDPNLAMTDACASPTSAPKTAEQEINGSRTALLNLGITPVDTLAYPYGGYNSNVESLVEAEGFVGARTVIYGYNTTASDLFALKNQLVNKTLTDDPNGLSTVKSWIDYANQNKVWLILTFHNVQKQADLTANAAINPIEVAEATSAEFFQSIVDYLKASNTCIATMHDGIGVLSSSTTLNCNAASSTIPPDTISPIISLTGSSTVNLLVGDTYTELGATAIDNMDGTINVSISGGPVSTATTTVFRLTYDAVDKAGNKAVQLTRTVSVAAPIATSTPAPVDVPPTPAPTPAPISRGGGGGGGGGGKRNPTTATHTSSTGQVLGANIFKFTINLQRGSNGNEVSELQKRLAKEGFYKTEITGFFGPITESALKAYQKKCGLEAAGVVGPKTREKLNGLAANIATPNITNMSVPQMQALIKDLQAQMAVLTKQLSQGN